MSLIPQFSLITWIQVSSANTQASNIFDIKQLITLIQTQPPITLQVRQCFGTTKVENFDVQVDQWVFIMIKADKNGYEYQSGSNKITSITFGAQQSPKQQLNPLHSIGSQTGLNRMYQYILYKKLLSTNALNQIKFGGVKPQTDLVFYYQFQQPYWILDNALLNKPTRQRGWIQSEFIKPCTEPPQYPSIQDSTFHSALLLINKEIPLAVTEPTHYLQSFTYELWVYREQTQFTNDKSILKLVDPSNNIAMNQFLMKQTGLFTNWRVNFNKIQGSSIQKTRQGLTHNWINVAFSYSKVGKVSNLIFSNELVTKTSDLFNDQIFAGNIVLGDTQSTLMVYLRELRMWNIYRTAYDIINFKNNDLTKLNHPNIINYYKLDSEHFDGIAIENKVRMHPIIGKSRYSGYLGQFLMKPEPQPLLICPHDQFYYGLSTPKCLSEQYEYQYEYTSTSIDQIQLTQPQGNRQLFDYWFRADGTTTQDYKVLQSQSDSVEINIFANQDIIQCKSRGLPVNQYHHQTSRFAGKWWHIAIESQGTIQVDMYLNQQYCKKQPGTDPALADLVFDLTPRTLTQSSIPPGITIKTRELRVWHGESGKPRMFQLMNSTIFDPYLIDDLFEYYQFDRRLVQSPQIYLNTNNPKAVTINVNQNTSLTKVDHLFCHLGMFKATFPDYKSCYLPRPVAIPFKQAQASSSGDQLFAKIESSNMDEVSFGFWYKQAFKSNKLNKGFITNPLLEDTNFEVFIQQSTKLTVCLARNCVLFSLTLNENSLLFNSRWRMFTSNAIIIHTSTTQTTSVQIDIYDYDKKIYSKQNSTTSSNDFNTTIITLQLGFRGLVDQSDEQPFAIRNFYLLKSRVYTFQMRVLLLSATHAQYMKRTTGAYFNSLSSSDSTHFYTDFRGHWIGEISYKFRYFIIDQNFPYHVCDERFLISDGPMSTCGSEGQLTLDTTKHYTVTTTSHHDQKNNLPDTTSNWVSNLQLTFNIWVYPHQLKIGKQHHIFSAGSNDIKDGLGVQKGISFALSYLTNNDGYTQHFYDQFVKDPPGTQFSSTIDGKQKKEAYENQWNFLTLIRRTSQQFSFYHFISGTDKNTVKVSYGYYYHTYHFGCYKLAPTSTGDCFDGRIRDFVVKLGAQPPNANQLNYQHPFKQNYIIYYNPLIGRASSYTQFINIVNNDQYPIESKGYLTDVNNWVYNNAIFFTKPTTRDPLIPPDTITTLNQTPLPSTLTIQDLQDTYSSYVISFSYQLRVIKLTQAETLFSISNVFHIDITLNMYYNLKLEGKIGVITLPTINSIVPNRWYVVTIGMSELLADKRKVYQNIELISKKLISGIITQSKLDIKTQYQIGMSRKCVFGQVYLWKMNKLDTNPRPNFYYQMHHSRQFHFEYANIESQIFLYYFIQPSYQLNISPSQIIKSSYYLKDYYQFNSNQDLFSANRYETSGKAYEQLALCNNPTQVYDGQSCIDGRVMMMGGQNKDYIFPLPKLNVDHFSISFYLMIEFKQSQYLQLFRTNYQYSTHLKTFTVQSSKNQGSLIGIAKDHKSNGEVTQTLSHNPFPNSGWLFYEFIFANDLCFFYMDHVQISRNAFNNIDFNNNPDTWYQFAYFSEQVFTIQHLVVRKVGAFNTNPEQVKKIRYIPTDILSYWPLRFVNEGKYLMDTIQSKRIYIGGSHWIMPNQISQIYEALIVCKGEYSYSSYDGKCKPQSQFMAEMKGQTQVKPKYLMNMMQSSNQEFDEWTVEMWFKVNYMNSIIINSGSKVWIVRLDDTHQAGTFLYYEMMDNIVYQQSQFIPNKNKKIPFTLDKKNMWKHWQMKYEYMQSKDNYRGWINNELDSLATMPDLQQFKLTSSQQIRFAYIDGTITGDDIRVGIQNFRIWNKNIKIHKTTSLSMNNLPPLYPNLLVNLFTNQNILQNTVKISNTYDMTDSNFYELKDMEYQHTFIADCSFYGTFNQLTSQCEPAYNSMFFPKAYAATPTYVNVKPFMQNKINDDDNSFSVLIMYRCVDSIKSKSTIISVKDNVDVYYEGLGSHSVKRQSTLHKYTTEDVCITKKIQSLAIHMNAYQGQINVIHYTYNIKKSFGYLNSNYLSNNNDRIVNLGSPGENEYKFEYYNFYLFSTQPSSGFIETFINTRSLTYGNGEASMMLDLFQSHTQQSGPLFVDQEYWISQNPVSKIILPYNPTPRQGVIFCPFSTYLDSTNSKCLPQSALVLKGKASIDLPMRPTPFYNEYTIYAFLKILKMPETIPFIKLENILEVEYDVGTNKIMLNQFTCTQPQTKQSMKSGFDVAKLQSQYNQIVIKKSPRFIQTIQNQQHKSIQRAECTNYETLSTISKFQINSLKGELSLSEIFIFQIELSSGDLFHMLRHGVNYATHERSLLGYYRFTEWRLTIYDKLHTDITLTLSDPKPPYSENSIHYTNGPMMPIQGYYQYYGYTSKENYLFIDQSPTNNFLQISNLQSDIQGEITIAGCIYGVQTMLSTKHKFMALKYQQSGALNQDTLFRTQSGTKSWNFNSNIYGLDTSKFDFHSVVNDNYKWVCWAHSIQSTSLPQQKDSITYFIRDGYDLSFHVQDQPNKVFTKQTQFRLLEISIGPSKPAIHGCSCFIAELKIFNTYYDPTYAYKYIMRNSISKTDYVSTLISYFKLDEGAYDVIVDSASSVEHFMAVQQQNPYPKWLSTNAPLVTCDQHFRYTNKLDKDGVCQKYRKYFLVKEPFVFQVEDNDVEGTLGYWYILTKRQSDYQIEIDGRYKYILHGDDQVRFKDHLDNELTNQKVVNQVISKWIYHTIRHISTTNIIKNDYHQQGNDFHYQVYDLKNPSVGALTQVRIGQNIDANKIHMILSEVVYYTKAIHYQSLSIRKGQNEYVLKNKDLPALNAYYPLDESGGQHVYSLSHYRGLLDRKIVKPATWVYFNEVVNGQQHESTYECYKPGFVLKGKFCIRKPYDCKNCINKDGHYECKGDPSVSGNCLNPSNGVYINAIKDYQECHSLCTKCTLPHVNKDCIDCVQTPLPMNVDKEGICKFKCKEGYAINTNSVGNNACQKCQENCNCPDDDFGNCTSCVQGYLFIIGNSYVDAQKCIKSCSIDEYYNSIAKKCIKCHISCAQCVQEGDQACKKCANPLYKLSNPQGGNCTKAICNIGQYNTNGVCNDCYHGCVACSGPSATQCSDCKVMQYYRIESNNSCNTIPGKYRAHIEHLTGTIFYKQKCNKLGQRLDELVFIRNKQNYCNDGNMVSGDGCSDRCEVEPGFVCDFGSFTSPDSCRDTIPPEVIIGSVQTEQNEIKVVLKFSEKLNSKFAEVQSSKDLALSISGHLKTYKLTWRVKPSVSSNQLSIYLIPQMSLSGTETLKITFLNKDRFQDLGNNSIKIDYITSKLIAYEYKNKILVNIVKNGGTAFQTTSIITIGINLLTSLLSGGVMLRSWDFINAIQILYYIPLINLQYPWVLRDTFKYLEFAIGDIPWPFDFYDDFLHKYIFFSLELNDSELNDNYSRFGIESTFIIKLYSNKIMLWLLIGLIYIPIKLICIGYKVFDCCKGRLGRRLLEMIEKEYRFNSLIRMLMELYLEMTLFAFINIYAINYSTYPNIIGSMMGIGFILLVTFLPSLFSITISRYFPSLTSPIFKSTYGTMIEGLKVLPGQHVLVHFYSFFMYRRFMYVQILVFLRLTPLIQCVCCVFKTICMLMFIIVLKPYTDKCQWLINIFNELTILVTFLLFSGYAYKFTEQLHSFILAFFIISILSIFTTINLIVIIFEIFKQIISIFKQAISKFKHTQPKSSTSTGNIQVFNITNINVYNTQTNTQNITTTQEKTTSQQAITSQDIFDPTIPQELIGQTNQTDGLQLPIRYESQKPKQGKQRKQKKRRKGKKRKAQIIEEGKEQVEGEDEEVNYYLQQIQEEFTPAKPYKLQWRK